MDYEIRPATEDDIDEVIRTVDTAYGEHTSEDGIASARPLYELDRTLAAFDHDGRPVGVAAAITFDLTVPGGAALTGCGFANIAVLPTHRRRGVLTALMARHLDESRERGEAVSSLIASQGGVYNRFGFGVATFAALAEIETHEGAFVSPVEAPADLRLLRPEEAAIVLPEIYDVYRRRQPGEVSRSVAYWDDLLRRADDLFVVASTDGYAAYRVREVWRNGQPRDECSVEEVVALTPAAGAGLWRYLLDLDLVSVVRSGCTPLDEPLRWLLADPRAMHVTRVRDWLWLQLVDVPKALAARRYAVAARLVIDVEDHGRYLLDGSPHGAECRPAPDQGPDLSINLADLGAAYLGGVSLATLARAGRVVEHTRGTLARADTLFRSDPPPHCTTDF